MYRLLIAGAMATVLSGCSAYVIPMNPAAERLGPIEVSSVRMGSTHGPVTVKVGDGEVLTGEYWGAFSLAQNLDFDRRSDVDHHDPRDFHLSGNAAAITSVMGHGPVRIVANGPKTQIQCQGRSGRRGYGEADCQTIDGAWWAIYW
jgi:hypothetical protein